MSLRILMAVVAWFALLCGAYGFNQTLDAEYARVFISLCLWPLFVLFLSFGLVAAILLQGRARCLWVGCCVFAIFGFLSNAGGMDSIGYEVADAVLGEAPTFPNIMTGIPAPKTPEQEALEEQLKKRHANLVSLVNLCIVSVLAILGVFVGGYFYRLNALSSLNN